MNDVVFSNSFPNSNRKSHVHIVSISGFDGSGRHTVATMLKNYIEQKGLADVKVFSLYDGIHDTIKTMCGIGKPSIANIDNADMIPSFWKDAFGKKSSYESVFTRFLNGFLSVNPNLFTYGIENRVESALNELRKHKDIVFIIPDVHQNRDVCMLQRYAEEGYDVVRCLVLRKNALPEWVLNIPDFNTDESMKRLADENYDVNWLMQEWTSKQNFDVILANDKSIDDLNDNAKIVADRIFGVKENV